jgi:hypothetical protein
MKGQWPKDKAFQNIYMATLFVSFGAKNLSIILMEPKFSPKGQLLFPNIYILHNLYISMDFYLVLLKGVVQGP